MCVVCDHHVEETCRIFYQVVLGHRLKIKMDDVMVKVKPNHLDRPLVAGCSVAHNSHLLHVGRRAKLKKVGASLCSGFHAADEFGFN